MYGYNPYKRPCVCPKQSQYTGTGAELGAAVGYYGEKYALPAARAVAKWFGVGDYTLRSNSLIKAGSTDTSKVEIIPAGPRETRIIYREYIGDVFTHPTTAGAFFAKQYPLNPGLVSLCPWLAPIAQQYEQWTPNGIIFEFRSTSSEYVATQALGSVIMATEYDSLDAAFSNKQDMLNAAYSNESKPSDRIVHGVECDPRDNPNRIFYVRSGAVPAGGSVRDYDLGTFTIATQGGSTANLNLGSLYVHYDITFRKEQLFGGVPMKGLLQGEWKMELPSAPYPLGASIPQEIKSTFQPGDISFTIGAGVHRIHLPKYTVGAKFLIIYFTEESSSTASVDVQGNTLCVGTGATTEEILLSPWMAATASRFMWGFYVTQTASTAFLTLGAQNSYPVGDMQAKLYIIQVNSTV